MSLEYNIGNYVTSFMQTRASMSTFSCEHIHVSQKLCRGTSFHSEHASQSFAWVKPLFSDMTLYVKNFILRMVRKLSHAVVHRFDLFMENFGDQHGVICLTLRIEMTS